MLTEFFSCFYLTQLILRIMKTLLNQGFPYLFNYLDLVKCFRQGVNLNLTVFENKKIP